jgi:protein-disulfide isomerase
VITSPWAPRVGLGLLALVVLGAVVSLSIGEGGPKGPQIVGSDQVQELLGGVRQDGRRLGNADAPVSISVFNDLQCAPCADYEVQTIDPLIDRYARGDAVQFEFRHLSFGGAETTLAAEAAIAAGGQAREWQYLDLFFRNQENVRSSRVTDTFLTDIASALPELDVAQWEADKDTDAVAEEAQADATLADNLHLPFDAPSVVVAGPGGQRQLTDSPSSGDIEAAITDVS